MRRRPIKVESLAYYRSRDAGPLPKSSVYDALNSPSEQPLLLPALLFAGDVPRGKDCLPSSQGWGHIFAYTFHSRPFSLPVLPFEG